MVSGIWKELPVATRFLLAVVIDILNTFNLEYVPVLSLLDPLLALVQFDLVTDLAPTKAQKLLLGLGCGEALLGHPRDILPLCSLVVLVTGGNEVPEELDDTGRPTPFGM